MSTSTSRDVQKRLIARLRTGLITSSVVGALGIAGYLGATSQTAAAATTDPDTSTTDTSSDAADTSSDTDSGTRSYYGDSPQVSSGSGSSHAQTSGS